MSTKIKIDNKLEPKRFFCEVCKFPLRGYLDFERDETHGCCNNCYVEFAEARRDSWLSGWRPKRKEVDSYIKLRNKIILSRRKS